MNLENVLKECYPVDQECEELSTDQASEEEMAALKEEGDHKATIETDWHDDTDAFNTKLTRGNMIQAVKDCKPEPELTLKEVVEEAMLMTIADSIQMEEDLTEAERRINRILY